MNWTYEDNEWHGEIRDERGRLALARVSIDSSRPNGWEFFVDSCPNSAQAWVSGDAEGAKQLAEAMAKLIARLP